jgi:hypothetical protein
MTYRRSPKGARGRREGTGGMGGHNISRAKRVDLLDHLRQERSDKAAACRKDVLGPQRRDSAAMLLAELSTSMSILV